MEICMYVCVYIYICLYVCICVSVKFVQVCFPHGKFLSYGGFLMSVLSFTSYFISLSWGTLKCHLILASNVRTSEGLLACISLFTSTLLPASSAQQYSPLHFILDTTFSLCCLRNKHLFTHAVHLVLASPWKLALQVSSASASLGKMSLLSFKETKRV